MIYGNNGDCATNSGNMTHWNDGKTQINSNGMTYGNGYTATSSGNMTHSGASTITSNGSQFYVNGQCYTLSNSMLYGPNGQTWTGVNSEQDAKNVILHNINK